MLNYICKFLNFPTETNHYTLQIFLGYINPQWRWIKNKANFFFKLLSNPHLPDSILLNDQLTNMHLTNNLYIHEFLYALHKLHLSRYLVPPSLPLPSKIEWNSLIKDVHPIFWASDSYSKIWNKPAFLHLNTILFYPFNCKPFTLPYFKIDSDFALSQICNYRSFITNSNHLFSPRKRHSCQILGKS